MDDHNDFEEPTVILNKYESDEFLDFEYPGELKNTIKALNVIGGN